MSSSCLAAPVFIAILIYLAGPIARDSGVRALCLECGNASGFMCLSETDFTPCFGGQPSADETMLRTCPAGLVCYDNGALCGSPALGVKADCPPPATTQAPQVTTAAPVRSCNVCSADRRYACVSATAFGLCFGSGAVVPNYVFACPKGEWCDLVAAEATGVKGAICTGDAKRISCGLQIPSTTSTSTPTSTSTLTIPTPVTDAPVTVPFPLPPSTIATQMCAEKRTAARFPMPQDTTCRKYFICYQRNGQFHAQPFECPGKTYFFQPLQRCQSPDYFKCVDGTTVQG